MTICGSNVVPQICNIRDFEVYGGILGYMEVFGVYEGI